MAPVDLSVVVTRSRPPPRSVTVMMKFSVENVPGSSLPSDPIIFDVAAEASWLSIMRSSVWLNCSRGVWFNGDEPPSPDCVCLLVADAAASRPGPLDGEPPKFGLTGT
jgi:hypothetical protein